MNIGVIIFIVTIVLYLPMAGVLLYVWWKHGKDEPAVAQARIMFLLGSVGLFVYMVVI